MSDSTYNYFAHESASRGAEALSSEPAVPPPSALATTPAEPGRDPPKGPKASLQGLDSSPPPVRAALPVPNQARNASGQAVDEFGRALRPGAEPADEVVDESVIRPAILLPPKGPSASTATSGPSPLGYDKLWNNQQYNNQRKSEFASPPPFEPRGRGRGGRGRARGRGRGDSSFRFEDREPQPDPYSRGFPAGRPEELSNIDTRAVKERECRTLFVRNIKYTTNPQELNDMFSKIGEIKSFFDLLGKRGMVFITYYDVRAASMAKDRLQGSLIAGRPIDVHYSLPKEEETRSRPDASKNQGSLLVRVRNSMQPISDFVLRQRFMEFGDIKDIVPYPASREDRVLEYYDSRAAQTALDRLNSTQMFGGTLELEWTWDEGPPIIDERAAQGIAVRDRSRPGFGRSDREEDRRRPPMGAGPPGYPLDSHDRFRPRSRSRSRSPPPRRYGHDRDYRDAPYDDRYPDRRPDDRFPPQNRFDRRSSPPRYPPADNRLDEAQRVQQLLSSLLPSSAAAGTPYAQAPVQQPYQASYPPPAQYAQQSLPQQQQAPFAFAQQPQQPYSQYPPTPAYQPSQVPVNNTAALLALLAQQQQNAAPPVPQYQPPPTSVDPRKQQPPQAGSAESVQYLLNMLAQQTKR